MINSEDNLILEALTTRYPSDPKVKQTMGVWSVDLYWIQCAHEHDGESGYMHMLTKIEQPNGRGHISPWHEHGIVQLFDKDFADRYVKGEFDYMYTADSRVISVPSSYCDDGVTPIKVVPKGGQVLKSQFTGDGTPPWTGLDHTSDFHDANILRGPFLYEWSFSGSPNFYNDIQMTNFYDRYIDFRDEKVGVATLGDI